MLQTGKLRPGGSACPLPASKGMVYKDIPDGMGVGGHTQAPGQPWRYSSSSWAPAHT